MLTLMERLLKNSTIKETEVLNKSKFFAKKDMIQTSVPMLNVAFSGSLDGGLTPGLTIWAGPSKNFKTGFSLLTSKAYLDKYNDAILLFYDSEFGSPQSYFDNFKIDTSRVIHTPITDIEQLKFDVMAQLKNINRGDHVIIVIDSVGNLASKKEVEDALEGKSVADMTRAKQLKSLFRMITPHLTIKDIPMLVVNHTYLEQGLFPKHILSGGTGIYYSASNIFIMGRQQEKEGTEITGYNFIINVEKSRYVREKSKIPIEVSFEEGISPWSGLLDVAMDGGFVIKPSNGWYSHKDSDKKFRQKDTYNKDFWLPILTSKEFRSYIESKYMIANTELLGNNLKNEDINEEFENASTI
jgi:RecA/RadA recombinase